MLKSVDRAKSQRRRKERQSRSLPHRRHPKLVAVEEEASLPPPPRPRYHIFHALQRAPSYLFVFTHLCYLYTLVVAFYKHIVLPSIAFQQAPDVLALWAHVRGMTPELLMRVLFPRQETSRWWQVRQRPAQNGRVTRQIKLRQLWSSPTTMFFLFGASYFAMTALVMLLRIVCHTTVNGVRFVFRYTLRHRQRHQQRIPETGEGGLYALCRYGNGYDSILRLTFALIELVWFVRFVHGFGLSETTSPEKGGDSMEALPLPTFPVYASRCLLVFAMETVLALAAIFDVQRLFHAFVGVRPLSVPNGYESCPLCQACWKVTRYTANRVHVCPELWIPLVAEGSSGSTAPATAAAPTASGVVGDDSDRYDEVHTLLLTTTDTEDRPGDIFPDPNELHWWTRMTYSWLSPVLNVALLSPFGTFSSPAAEAFIDGGNALWKAQLAVVARLPRLPVGLSARHLSDEAWILWKTRRRNAADEAAIARRRGYVERGFFWMTKPLRGLLMRAYAAYFLPPKTSVLKAQIQVPSKDEIMLTNHASPLRRISKEVNAATANAVKRVDNELQGRPKGLFALFMEHPSGREYIYVCGPLKALQDTLSLLAPHMLRTLVLFLREVGTAVATSTPRRRNGREEFLPSPGESYVGRGLLVCAGLLLCVFLQAFFFQSYLDHLYSVSLKVSSTLKSMVLRHTLETPLAYVSQDKDCSSDAETVGDDSDDSNGCTARTEEITESRHENRQNPSDPAERDRDLECNDTSLVINPTLAVTGSPRGHSRSHLVPSSSRTATCVVEKKAAHNDSSAAKTDLTGETEIVSLVTIDAANCGDTLIFLHNVWGHPLLIITSLLNMYAYVGWFPTAVTFVMLAAATSLNKRSAAAVRIAQQKAKDSGPRLKDLNTVLSNMRTVKAMALEESMWQRVEEAHRSESEGSQSVVRAESIAVAHTELITLGIALACCGSYLLHGGSMDAAVLVPTMAALTVMRFPLWTLPQLFSQVTRGYTSMKKLERFLAREVVVRRSTGTTEDVSHMEKPVNCSSILDGSLSNCGDCDDTACSPTSPARSSVHSLQSNHTTNAFRGAVICNDWNFSWARPLQLPVWSSHTTNRKTSPGGGGAVLQNVCMSVLPGEFVVIRGPTGSGKSAMLLAMLGELWPSRGKRPHHHSHLSVADDSNHLSALSLKQSAQQRKVKGFRLCGRVAYCAEIPWLRNLTVRENIRLLPDDAPESREERAFYERVLSACALTRDLDAMPLGDRTVVGENGSRLSGGQRARVALARAVLYRDRVDIFLFDDILSALDVEVQKHLIAEVFHGILCDSPEMGDPSAEARLQGDEEPHIMSGGTPPSPKPKRQKTIVLATHVADDVLMPDRLFHLHGNGTVQEQLAYERPSEAVIRTQKAAWRDSADRTASPAAESNPDDDRPSSIATTTADGPAASTTSNPATVFNAKRFTLLPEGADLKTLFVTYMGHRRLIALLSLFVLAQLGQTCTDNWLAIWISLHRDKDEEAFSLRATILKVASLPIQLIKGNPTVTLKPKLHFTSTTWYGVLFEFAYFHLVTAQDTIVLQFLCSFALVGFVAASLSFFRTRTFFLSYQRIADTLQLRAVKRILGAPVSYFDRVPTSGLLHVLSRDQEVVDHALADSVQLILITIFQLLAMVCFNAAQHAAFLVVVPLSALLFYHLTLRYLLLTKQVRTLESKLHARSVAIIKEAARGSITIRAYGRELKTRIDAEMDEALDAVNAAAHVGLAADRWVAIRLEMVALIMTGTLSLLAVFSVCFAERTKGNRMNSSAVAAAAAYAGLGVTSSLTASKSMSILCRRIGLFQNQYVSAEQLLRLQRDIPVEPAPPPATMQSDEDDSSDQGNEQDDTFLMSETSSAESTTPSPAEGAQINIRPIMEVRGLSAKYQRHLPWVLHNVNLKLFPGECVGLIGRTGNGKSSLFNAFLQLMDVMRGEMLIQWPPSRRGSELKNALELSPVPLRRHFFELVSQEPLLMEGTCRFNLLLGMESEAEAAGIDSRLWEVIQKVQLDQRLSALPFCTENTGGTAATPTTADVEGVGVARTKEEVLQYPIAGGGANLSAGQRQLLCLARALLHKPQVVLLDEISSRVDHETDRLIQRIIREELLGRRDGNTNGPVKPARSPASPATHTGVFLIAHRLETILSLCDRVLVIERGRCIANLSVKAVSSLADLESYL